MLNLEDDQFLNEIFSEIAVEIAEPSYVLSGSGIGWFLDPISKEMVRISRGVELIPVSSTWLKVLIRYPGSGG